MRGLQEKIPGLAVGAVGKSCRVSIYRGRDETFWSVGVIVEFSEYFGCSFGSSFSFPSAYPDEVIAA